MLYKKVIRCCTGIWILKHNLVASHTLEVNLLHNANHSEMEDWEENFFQGTWRGNYGPGIVNKIKLFYIVSTRNSAVLGLKSKASIVCSLEKYVPVYQASTVEQHVGTSEHWKPHKEAKGLTTQPVASTQGIGQGYKGDSGLGPQLGSPEPGFGPDSETGSGPDSEPGPVSELGRREEPGPMPQDAISTTKASGAPQEAATPPGKGVKKGAPPPAPPNLLLAAMKTGAHGIKRAPQVRRISGFENDHCANCHIVYKKVPVSTRPMASL